MPMRPRASWAPGRCGDALRRVRLRRGPDLLAAGRRRAGGPGRAGGAAGVRGAAADLQDRRPRRQGVHRGQGPGAGHRHRRGQPGGRDRLACGRRDVRAGLDAVSVARFGGSWAFIITFGVVLIAWVVVNIGLATRAWDPYPFILLNLFLSMLAAIQAPVIMMSQNRQDTKDRLRGELDYDVNRRAESEIQGLSRKLNLIDDKIADIHNHLHVKS